MFFPAGGRRLIRRLGGLAGRVHSTILGRVDGVAYIPSKKLKYLIKQISTVFPTVPTGFCVVCTVLQLPYYVGNCLLSRFYVFIHLKHLIGNIIGSLLGG